MTDDSRRLGAISQVPENDGAPAEQTSSGRRRMLRLLGAGAVAGAVAGSRSGQAGASLNDPLLEGTNAPTTPYIVQSSIGVTALQIDASGNGGALAAAGSGVSPTVQLSTGAGGQPALLIQDPGVPNVDALVVEGPSSLGEVSTGPLHAGSNAQDVSAIDALGVGTAILGKAVSTGVEGQGIVGVRGNGYGMVASSGVGVEAMGGLANLRLVPAGSAPWDRRSMGNTKVAYQGGELVMDEAYQLWVCVVPGEAAPENFRLVAAPTTGSVGGTGFVAIDPIRWWDTRDHEPVAGGTALGIPAPPAVPAEAQAVLVNVAVTNTRAGGWLAVYPGPNWPGTSLVNWWAAGQTIANSTSVKLGANRVLWFKAGVSTADIVVDIYGYYR